MREETHKRLNKILRPKDESKIQRQSKDEETHKLLNKIIRSEDALRLKSDADGKRPESFVWRESRHSWKNKRCWRQTSQLPRRQKLRGGPPNPTEQSGEEVRRFCIESGAQRQAAENSNGMVTWKRLSEENHVAVQRNNIQLLTLPVNGGCVKCNPVTQQQITMQRNLSYPVTDCLAELGVFLGNLFTSFTMTRFGE